MEPPTDRYVESTVEKMRRSFDAKLRKERQLATTRLLERDALARQVRHAHCRPPHGAPLGAPVEDPMEPPSH